MGQFFGIKGQNARISVILQKKQCFEKQIRKKDRNQKIRQLRQLQNMPKDQPNLESLVNALPNSLQDLVMFIISKPEYSKLISRLVIDLIYETQLKGQVQASQNQPKFANFYRLTKSQDPKNDKQVEQQFYLFNTLLEQQGIYAQKLLSRYFQLLFSRCKNMNRPQLLFQSLSIVVKNSQLNWVPIREIVSLINYLSGFKKLKVLNEQMQVYYLLSKNYFLAIKQTYQIKERIRTILEQGSKIFQQIKHKVFVKFCINLTFYQNHISQNDSKEDICFYQSLIKGQIYKILFRNIFFAADSKIRLLCLALLRNLICEFGSQVIWRQQKLNHIEHFQSQIKNKNNDLRTFQALSEIFLISILKIPSKELLQNTIEGEVDSLELIAYILQNTGNQNQSVKQFALSCLQLFLEQFSFQKSREIAHILQRDNWKKLIGQDDMLYERIDHIIEQQE